MKVFVNNKQHEIRALLLSDILPEININASRGIAVAINNEVIPKTEWNSHMVQENDRLTIIRASQGG